jgi:hypothetical protein
MILKGLIIVQTAFDDLEGTHHCEASNAVCTMMSPFKIIKCCLHNDESLQDHQMLFAQ